MKKVKCLVEQCKASGKRLKKGKTYEISDSDARFLCGTGVCSYADKKDEPAKNRGLTSDDLKVK